MFLPIAAVLYMSAEALSPKGIERRLITDQKDRRESRGWLLGHFIDPDQGARSSKDGEVKWGSTRSAINVPSGLPMISGGPWCCRWREFQD